MNGKVVIGTELDTKKFDAQIKNIEDELERIEKALSRPKTYGLGQDDMENLNIQAEKLRNKLVDLKAKQNAINTPNKGAVNWAEDFGKSLTKNIKKISRLILGIFGIRSAYMAVRSAVSTLTSENEQLSTDIQYMKWVLAQSLKPVVEWLIQALYTAMSIINLITKSLFRYDIFAGKSAEDFRSMKKDSGGVAKNLSDAKKQLAGFDEMNVLQDNKTSGATGVGADVGMGDWKGPDLEEGEKKVKKFAEDTKSIGEEIRHYIEDVPWSAWIDAFGLLGISVKGITEIFYGLWSVIKGVFDFLKGIVEVIVGLILGDTELINKGIQDIINGLVEFITGVIYIIIGIVHTVAGVVIEILYEVIMSIWKFIKWLWDGIVNVATSITEFVTKVFTTIGNWIGDRITDLINFFKSIPEIVKSVFDLVWNFIKGVVSKIISLFKEIGTKVGDVIGGAFKSVINGVLSAVENILNAPIKAINKLINKINDIPGINLKTLSTFNLPRLAKGGIINMPGRGVMVGNAIGGERGMEGV